MSFLITRLFWQKENINEVAWTYASLLNLRVTKKSLLKAIDEHPDYPSLLALTDTFSFFGSETLAAKVSTEQLLELDQPYIAKLYPKFGLDNLFTVVKPVDDKHIVYLHPLKRKWEQIPIDEFEKFFAGVVFFAEPRENAGEINYEKHQQSEKLNQVKTVLSVSIAGLLLLTVSAMKLIQFQSQGLLSLIYFLLSLTGLGVGLLLLWHEIDRDHKALKEVCSGGKRVNCDAILQSSFSRVLGVSWSFIGFMYFAGLVLVQLIGGVYPLPLLQLLSLLSLLALPYTIFSVYYQWRVIKQWCKLCLWTQGVLALQAIVVLMAAWPTFQFGLISFSEVMILVVSFGMPILGGQLVVSALKKVKELRESQKRLNRIKNNPIVFQALLEKQRAVSLDSSGLGIILGNPDARHSIIKVCNPYCGPCAKSHKKLEEMLVDNPDVKVQIIFTATLKEDDYRLLPVRHFMAIAEKNDKEITKHALDEWYNSAEKDYGQFAKRYPMNGELMQQNAKIAAMNKWCDEMKISFTPTFFVNGNQLPDVYSVDDLNYILKS